MKNLQILLFCALYISTTAHPIDSASFYFEKAKIEQDAKRNLVASQLFKKAYELNPKYKDAYLQNGYVNLEMRKINDAKICFEKVIELEPNNKLAIQELTEIYFSYRQYNEAILFAKKCTSCTNADNIIAQSYFKLEDYGNAEKALLIMFSKNPQNANTAHALGQTYLELEQVTKSINYFVKAIELDPKNVQWIYDLGTLYSDINNHKTAAIYYEKAASLGYVQTSDFKENLGFTYLFCGQVEKAEALLNEIISKKPGNKTLLRDVAQAYYDSKFFDKSLAYCQKLMELDDKDGKALYQAGLCFIKKGQQSKGQGMCDKAIELDPTLAGLRDKRMNIAGL